MQWIVEGLRAAAHRYGRARVNIAVGYALFVVAAALVSMLTALLYTVPEIAEVGLVQEQLQRVRSIVFDTTAVLLIVLCGFGFIAIWFGVVQPIQAFRERAIAKLSDTSTAEALALSEKSLQRAREQLQVALQDNIELRRELRALRGIEVRADALVEALVAAYTDPMVLVGADGRIVDLTRSACEIAGCSREAAVGQPFAAVLRIYDGTKETPREHPLDHLVAQALEAPSALPRIQSVVLLDQRDVERRAIFSIASVIDRDGHCAGATVRIAPAQSDAGKLPEPMAQSLVVQSVREDVRKQFGDRIEELIRLARMREERHCLLWIRLDQVATISDQHGYLAAEELVRRMAQLVRERLGEKGECYEMATDRIAVLLGFRSLQEGRTTAEHLRQAIASRQIPWKGARLSVTASVAVVPIDAASEGRAQVLAVAEDLVLAIAAAGGNAVRVDEPNEQHLSRRRLDREWLEWIKPRLGDGRAHFISQEIVPLSPGASKPSLECYLRVEDDDGVWLTPGAFMPSLERLRQTGMADLWVLRAVLEQMEREAEAMDGYDTVFLNFSAESLLDAEFNDRVFHTLASSSIPPSRISFEFDERVAAMYAEAFCRFAEIVRPTGAGIALDRCRWTINDELIRRAGVGYIKFHESVIKRAMHDRYDRAHLEWLRTASGLLNVRTVACGVEDEATLEEMRRIGIDYAQGVILNKMGLLMA
ncbi:diguanylate cyclase (GGDEF) domain-containing protein [Fontimonas thermophila]|uniref:Diguanylate cyclase (GGDEF) domain-containing protein n=1 Tax=Fontimonas thermophila TaxID=1076937 RepID=A0A1I2HQ25_9GAMM|nr:EAL domain-containing protein [Fontimonas thermophila]SFF30471.1 diguanylate cyclase (GGDEF) domain-containing protein [Fontimonas thermophila]